MIHKHSVYDTDTHFKIAVPGGTITSAASTSTILVQNNHNSERMTFEIPRYIEGHDMTLCDTVQVHYINIAANGMDSQPGVYEVEDLDMSPTDQEKTAIFSWLVSRNATRYVGTLSFAIRMVCTEEGEVVYEWNTVIYSGIPVAESIYNSDIIVADYTDVLAQWEERLFGAGESALTDIESARVAAVESVTATGTEEIEKIKEAGLNQRDIVIEGIPEDYTALSETVEGIKIVVDGIANDTETWTNLQQLADAQVFGRIYNYGDQFVETWTDTATEKSYEYPFRLNHIADVELEDGTTLAKRPFLQAHYAHPFGVQFSHQRAFLACPDGLAAGTYYFTIESSWGSNGYVVAGDVVCFTLTKAVPAGGKLAGCWSAPDTAKTNWRIYSYSADGKTRLETVTPTFTASGTDLGIQKLNKRNGNLNSTQEMAYGWNRWSTSALRQYLNSSAAAGEWWTAQDEWDIVPDQHASKPGFLSGLSAEFLAALKTVKVTTYTNTVNDGGAADITYDKVFLPSLEQIYVKPQITGEGEYHEYWKQRSGATSPLAQGGTHTNMISYAVENHSSAQTVRLRSANRGYAHHTWCVGSSGGVYGVHASNAYRFSPLVVI